jgi:hypothetical protein
LDNPLKHILQELEYFVPENYTPRVSLLDANGRKKKRNASADNWSPESDRIEIRFEPARPKRAQLAAPEVKADYVDASSAASKSRTYVHPAETGLIRVLIMTLNRAESKPGWSFVPLKKFRDEILPAESAPSMRTDIERQNVLRSAIDKKLIIVGRVPNPKAPEFPVTTIRLNRLLPEVQRMLGQEVNPELDFHPVEIRGESLSATVLRERR